MKDGYYAFYVNSSSEIIDTSYSPEKGGTYDPGSIVTIDPTDISDIVKLSNTYVNKKGV